MPQPAVDELDVELLTAQFAIFAIFAIFAMNWWDVPHSPTDKPKWLASCSFPICCW